MKKLLALILALIMALSMGLLAGCGDDDSSSGKSSDKKSSSEEADEEDGEDVADLDAEEVFDGEWETTIDFATLLRAEMGDDADYFDDFEMPVTVIFNFDDGEYSMEADESSAKAAVKSIESVYKKGLKKYLLENLNVEEDELDDFIAENSEYSTFDDYFEYQLDYTQDMITDSFGNDGDYTVDGNKIDFDDGEAVFEFTIQSSKKIKFTKLIEGEDEMAESLPWTLKKK